MPVSAKEARRSRAESKSSLPKGFREQVTELGDLRSEAVEGFGAQLAPLFRREAGRILGSLNSIGALRSGATTANLDRLTETFATTVANIGAQQTGVGDALSLRALQLQEDEAKNRRKDRFFGSVGKILGVGASVAIPGLPSFG